MNVMPAEQLSPVGVGGGGDEPAGLDATLALEGGEADEVQGNVLQDGEIVGSVAGTGAHLIVGEDHIHAPVQTVFDRPVGTNYCADFNSTLSDWRSPRCPKQGNRTKMTNATSANSKNIR